jgi:hypothetical protein
LIARQQAIVLVSCDQKSREQGKAVNILMSKGRTADTTEIRRSDGSVIRTSFPHKGLFPHDAVHFFVELALSINGGFWGLIAGGRHPEEVAAIVKAGGHASAARAGMPSAKIVSAVQSERIVECFEADLWSGGSDARTFREVVAAACYQSHVPDFPIEDQAIERLRRELNAFHEYWAALPLGGTCSFDWPDELTTR